MIIDSNNISKAADVSSGIFFTENPMVLAWVQGTMVFMLILIATVLIGVSLWLLFGRGRRTGI